LKSEVVSDLFGERSILLGAVHGIVEALYQRYLEAGAGPEEAFSRACESLTGPIRETISRHGWSHSTSTWTRKGGGIPARLATPYSSFKGVMGEIRALPSQVLVECDKPCREIVSRVGPVSDSHARLKCSSGPAPASR